MPARILIVEDEFLIANNLMAVLEDAGHEPIGIAPDLTSAMELAQERPDLALVDVHLRDGPTGPVIAEKLTREHGVPVLFVTANPRMISGPPSAGLGVLGKPCDDRVIEAAVDYALRIRAGEAAGQPPYGLNLLEPGLSAAS
jgi:DNA-binding response OmpR family regulator